MVTIDYGYYQLWLLSIMVIIDNGCYWLSASLRWLSPFSFSSPSFPLHCNVSDLVPSRDLLVQMSICFVQYTLPNLRFDSVSTSMVTIDYGSYWLWLFSIIVVIDYGYDQLWLLSIVVISNNGYNRFLLLLILVIIDYGYYRLCMVTIENYHQRIWLLLPSSQWTLVGYLWWKQQSGWPNE